MSWTNKAVLAWGWTLTPLQVATLPVKVYEEWIDNEWLLYSENTDTKIFAYFYIDIDVEDSPKNVTDLSPEINKEEIAKKVEAFHKAFPTRTDESQAYLWSIIR